MHPKPSPTNDEILFYSINDGDYFISIVNTDRSNLHRISPENEVCYHGIWLSDGDRIAYLKKIDAETSDNEIYIMDKDGNNDFRITNNDFIETGLQFVPK